MTSKIVLAFVTLLVGVILVGVVASETIARTDKTIISNETITIDAQTAWNVTGAGGCVSNQTYEHYPANGPTGWKTTDCPLTSVEFGNANSTGSSGWTLDTDYQIDLATGNVTLLNTTKVNDICSNDEGNTNTTYIDYTYCSDDYLNLSWGRTVLDLVAGFFAIAILMISVGLFYSIGKDANII